MISHEKLAGIVTGQGLNPRPKGHRFKPVGRMNIPGCDRRIEPLARPEALFLGAQVVEGVQSSAGHPSHQFSIVLDSQPNKM